MPQKRVADGSDRLAAFLADDPATQICFGAPRLIGSASNEAIHGTLLHWLFRPSQALQRELEAEWMPRFLGQHVIGIQVRTSYAEDAHSDAKKSNACFG